MIEKPVALVTGGAIEIGAAVLQIYKGFLHPSINCEDVHPDIEKFAQKIPQKCLEFSQLKIIAKAGFGFGDVNSCIIFKKWEET
jgi:3-oxoacyl-(acyl-carrier-protein) synthase